MLLSPLPFADQARSHIQVSGKHSLARLFASTKSANLPWSHFANGCQTKCVELAQGAPIHPANAMQIGRCFMNGGHDITSIFLRHSLLLPGL